MTGSSLAAVEGIRARLRRLDLFLCLWDDLPEEWRERLAEEVRAVVRLLTTRRATYRLP